MTDPGDCGGPPPEQVEGPPDPQLDPARSPGVGTDVEGLADIEVSREDVDIGEADPAELTAGDTSSVEDADPAALLADLESGSPTERKRAAIELAGRERNDAALRALAERVRADDDPDVRQFAVEAVGEMGGPGAATVALAALEDPDPWVRAEAVVALDALDRERFADEIEAALSDDHHAVRRNALVSLWKRRGPNVFDTAVEFVEDESSRVREWAATILAEAEGERAREALATLAEDDDDVVAKTARAALDDESVRGGRGPPTESRRDTPPDL